MEAIEISGLQYVYTDHGRPFTALEQIDLKINKGEFVCILGRSGCGKTTLLRLMAGLQLPQKGSILINGEKVEGPGTDRAVVFQNYALFPWMTVQKNVQFGIKQARKKLDRHEVREIALEFLEKVGMKDSAGKYPYQLSGGMQQRAAIARALAMDTDILLLDEPFGALDVRNRRELQALTESLWRSSSKTFVFVTHDISEAVLLADRIIYMTPGEIRSEIPVNLPRPRNLESPEAKELLRKLTGLFYESGEWEEER